MKKVALFLIAMSVLLSGCIVYPNRDAGMHRGGHERSHERSHDRDRDGDGVPNRHDRRPDDSRRN